jgi:ankyrin repeat protein
MTELLHALAFDPDDAEVHTDNLTTPKTVIKACLGFVEHREDSDLVQFTHATVEEYLREEQSGSFDPFVREVGRSCVRYLTQPAFVSEACRDLSDMVTRLANFPLMGYAALYWGAHVYEVQLESMSEISKLVGTRNALSSAAQAFHYLRRAKNHVSAAAFSELPKNFGKMHMLALWGLKDIAMLESPSYADIVRPDSLGWTPLHWAAARGHRPMIDFLLSRGAEIESEDLRRWTPVFWATYWARIDALTDLLDKGAAFQIQDINGDTPLHVAAQRGCPEACAELLQRGADRLIKSSLGSSPFDEALRSQVPEIAAMFLDPADSVPDQGPVLPITEETLLERAVTRNPLSHNSAFRLLLEGETTAAEETDWPRPLLPRLTQYAEKLCEKDPERLTSIGTAFSYSMAPEDLINQPDYVAGVLGYAILTEQIEMVKALIEFGVDLNKPWRRRWTRIYEEQFPVLLASFVGNAELISFLVDSGAKVDVQDYDGRNPLHYAVILGHIEAACVLCTNATLLRAQDELGKTAMHLVWQPMKRHATQTATAERLETALALTRLLAQNGGREFLNLPDRNGCTPLHDAVRTGSLEAVKLLIQLEAAINIRANFFLQDWEWSRLPKFQREQDTVLGLQFAHTRMLTLMPITYERQITRAIQP